MVENEKITTENKEIIPETILSDTVETTDTLPEETITTESEIKVEEPQETITTESEIKVEKPETIKVADAKLTKDQQIDLNKLLEMGESAADAKAIVTGTYKGKVEKIDFNKSEFEVDKEFLATDGIDLELSIKARKKGKEVSEQILVDSAGIEEEGGYISAKTLYEMKGYKADKENEIKGEIRFNLGFGLDQDQYKESNIKNMLIKQITDSGKYDKEVLANYLNKIEVKTVDLSAYDQKKKGLVYRIPKELGGTNMFSAVDSPKISSDDFRDAVADSGPIIASIVGSTVGSMGGPAGTVVGGAIPAGLTEMARLMYGYHELGLQKDQFTEEEFFNYAAKASMKYALIDAAATGVFLAGAKLILPTILGKSNLSTNTIKEFIETKGKTNTGVFKKVNEVKEQMQKDLNLTKDEVDTYFSVSLGKAILDSDQLIKKGSEAQRALLSDEVVRLETNSKFKAIELKILKKTTGLSEVGNKQADEFISKIEQQIKGEADIAIRESELALLNNTKQIALLEKSFVNDAATRYLDEFGVTLDDTYRAIQSRLSTLDNEVQSGILKNNAKINLDLKKTLSIINKEMKGFSLKGILPSKILKVPSIKKGAKPENVASAISNNKMVALASMINEKGFKATGDAMKIIKEGFEELSKKELTIKDIYTLRNAVNLLEETATNSTSIGQLRKLSGSLTQNISKAIVKSEDNALNAAFKSQSELLNLKRITLFKNFSQEFGGGTNPSGIQTAINRSESLFKKIIDDSIPARAEADAFGQLIKNGVVPESTILNIKQALYRNYFNQVVPGSDGVAKMAHSEFFKKFGKNYESLLGKSEYLKLRNTQSVFKQFDDLASLVANQNASVQKYLPGIGNWDALSASGPGEIVAHILSDGFSKTNNLTKLLNALPTKTGNQIRSLFLTQMMKEVQSGVGFVPGLTAKGGGFKEGLKTFGVGSKFLGGKNTGTLNGAKLNLFLSNKRSIVTQMLGNDFFKVYRSMADVLEMLQIPVTKGAKDTSMAEASKNAALFIDMIYGPLNHKRLILNRVSTLADRIGVNQDNLFLFSDYGIFIEAAKKNFLAGNYPAWIGKLPEKERVTFIDKALKAIKLDNTRAGQILSKEMNLDSIINRLNIGFNRGAGRRESFNLLPKKGNRLAPLKNPIVQKEYLEDKYEELKGKDNMQEDADMFFPIDVAGKYAIKALEAVFVDVPVKTYKGAKKLFSDVKAVEERDIKEEEFREELEN